jgi:hypothetical protein
MEALAREEIGELDPGAARFPPHHAVGGPEVGGRHIELLHRHVDQRFPRSTTGKSAPPGFFLGPASQPKPS